MVNEKLICFPQTISKKQQKQLCHCSGNSLPASIRYFCFRFKLHQAFFAQQLASLIVVQYENDSVVECFRFGSGTFVAKEDKKCAEIAIKLHYIVTIRIMVDFLPGFFFSFSAQWLIQHLSPNGSLLVHYRRSSKSTLR